MKNLKYMSLMLALLCVVSLGFTSCGDDDDEDDTPAPTIVMASDSISGDWSVHPGYKLPDETYSDPRPFSVAELFAISGLPDSYCNDIPDWARGNEKLLRQLIGESFCPLVVKRLMQELKKILPTFKS